MAEEANAQFKVKQGVTLKVYRDNKFPSSIVVSYSAAAKMALYLKEMIH